MEVLIETYKSNLESFSDNCKNISTDKEYRDLFRGIIIMFLEDFIELYNKLSIRIPELKSNKTIEKVDNLKKLLDILNNDGIILGIDCNEIILRGYINYFYTLYRDDLMTWNLSALKINEDNIKEKVIDVANTENAIDIASNYLDIIHEIVLMFDNTKDKDKLKMIYILNNLNTVIDIYLGKKSLKML